MKIDIMFIIIQQLPGDYQIVYAFPIDNRGVPVPVGHIADLYKKSPKTAKYRAFTAKEIYSYCKIISNVSDKIIDEKLGTGELYKLFEAAEEAGEVINDTMHKLSIDGDGEAHGNFKAALKTLAICMLVHGLFLQIVENICLMFCLLGIVLQLIHSIIYQINNYPLDILNNMSTGVLNAHTNSHDLR